jgi:hypothetical protein
VRFGDRDWRAFRDAARPIKIAPLPRNLFEAVVARQEPISDVYSHHRALTTCHLAGIAARFGRKITWDPTRETIVDDPRAQAFLARERRQGFEIAGERLANGRAGGEACAGECDRRVSSMRLE